MKQKIIHLLYYLFAASLFIGKGPENIFFYILLIFLIISMIADKKLLIESRYLNYIIFIYSGVILLLDFLKFDIIIFKSGLSHVTKILLIFIIIFLITEKKVLIIGLKIFVVFGILSALFSIIAYFTEWNFLERMVINFGYSKIIVGFAGEHWIRYSTKLSFALILLICYLFSILFDKNKSVIIKYISFFGIIILMLGIFYTGSRGVILGLFIGSIVLLLFKNFRLVPLVLLVIGLITFIISYNTSSNIESRINKFSEDASFRAGVWYVIIKNWDKFVIGYGTGNFENAMAKAELDSVVELIKEGKFISHAHNNIFEFFVSYGILGILLFLYFWIGVILIIFYYYKKSKEIMQEYKWFAVSVFWILLSFHINGITESVWVLATTSYTICFVMGTFISLCKK